MATDASLSIHVLSDDLLALVLQWVLPAPGVVISRSACRYRQAVLKHASILGRYPFRDAEDWQQAWHACLAGFPAPSLLHEHPIWHADPVADSLYASDVGLPGLLVCKRWCRLLHGSAVKVAVLGEGERPPTSTEVLVVAAAFVGQAEEPAASGQQSTDPAPLARAYLHGLQHLRAIFLFRGLAFPDGGFYSNTGHMPRGPAWDLFAHAVPDDLKHLQHLVYLDLRGELGGCVSAESGMAMPRDIAALSRLQTLGLFNHECSDREWSAVLSALPQLSTLLAPRHTIRGRECSSLTKLGKLMARFRVEAGDQVEAATLKLPPLSQLRGLECLKVDCVRSDVPRLDVSGFSALLSLTLLSIRCFTLSCGAEELAALTALKSIEIDRTGSHIDAPDAAEQVHAAFDVLVPSLGAWPHLTRVAFSDIKPARAAALSACSRLVDLDLSLAPDAHAGPSRLYPDFTRERPDSLSTFTSLTGLTALRLKHAFLQRGACKALVRMPRLRRLRLDGCELACEAALLWLTSLQELSLHAGTRAVVARTSQSWVFPLRLPLACQGLERLDISQRLSTVAGMHELLSDPPPERVHVCAYTLSTSANLKDLTLCMNKVCDEGLSGLQCLHHLTALRLFGSETLHAKGLRHLLAVPALQVVDLEHYLLYVGPKRGAAHRENVLALARRGVAVLGSREPHCEVLDAFRSRDAA